MPRYTLIIPHHNIPTLLDRLLQTVPRRDDMQVIVVDDCSTEQLDQLEEVKNKYPWVEWYSTDTNGGGGKARNVGLEHAIGDYLIFADADDYFLPAFDNLLNEYKDREFDILYFSAYKVHPSKKELRESFTSEIINEVSESNDIGYIRYYLAHPWCKIINKSVVEKNHIKFQECRVGNDMMFSVQVESNSSKIYLSKEYVYVYIIREESTFNPFNKEKMLTLFQNELKIYDYFKRKEINYSSYTNDNIIIYTLRFIITLNVKYYKEVRNVIRTSDVSYYDFMKLVYRYILHKVIFYNRWNVSRRIKVRNLLQKL